LQGYNRVSKFARVEENRAAAQFAVDAQGTIRIGLDLIGIGGQRVVGVAEIPIGFGEAVEGFFATIALRKVGDEA